MSIESSVYTVQRVHIPLLYYTLFSAKPILSYIGAMPVFRIMYYFMDVDFFVMKFYTLRTGRSMNSIEQHVVNYYCLILKLHRKPVD